MRHDHIRMLIDQLGCLRAHDTGVAGRPPQVETKISAFDPAGSLESLSKCGYPDAPFRVAFRDAHEGADQPHTIRLLRARRNRPSRRRASEQRDELAPPHSITSSVRPISGSGTTRPRALAVLRLTISSTLVVCWTGKSAGFSPLRTRPVYTPACRYAPRALPA